MRVRSLRAVFIINTIQNVSCNYLLILACSNMIGFPANPCLQFSIDPIKRSSFREHLSIKKTFEIKMADNLVFFAVCGVFSFETINVRAWIAPSFPRPVSKKRKRTYARDNNPSDNLGNQISGAFISRFWHDVSFDVL